MRTPAPPSPRVTVVVPAFNGADTIAEAVDSVLHQTYSNIEILVVDDGSTDETPRILSGYGDDVRVIRQDNRGLAAARSVGHEAATGSLIAWLDADDVAHPERIEVQVALMNLVPSLAIVGSDFAAFDATGEIEARHARSYYGAISGEGSLDEIFGPVASVHAAGRDWRYYSGPALSTVMFGNFLHPPTVMIRQEAIARAGALDGSVPSSEDWLYFVKLARIGSVAFIDEPLIGYRISPDQMSSMSKNAKRVVSNNLIGFERVVAENRDIADQYPARVRRTRGRRHAALASVLADDEPIAALASLIRALRYTRPTLSMLKTSVKALLPRRGLSALRSYRASRN